MSAGEWWREGVIYQVYPRSFQDSNADGIGDLRGVIDRLDYLQWLGIDAIWLNPVFGDLGTVDQLIAEAKKRDIKIVLDILPNHSSDRHPWFIDARSSRHPTHRDWYVWADPKADGSLPLSPWEGAVCSSAST